MTTVKELKEWLNNFPEDTEVEVLYQEGPGDEPSFRGLELDVSRIGKWNTIGDGWKFTDFTGERFNSIPSYGRKILRLGER